MKKIDVTPFIGQKFGSWTVLGFSHMDDVKEQHWSVRCDCGVEDTRLAYSLRNGKSTRCTPCARPNGPANKWYKTGRRLTTKGYVILSGHRDHPNRNAAGLAEHVYVMSKAIGRPLIKGEMVHHKNGNRADNRIENLELCWTQPPGQRVEDLITYLESTGHKIERPKWL